MLTLLLFHVTVDIAVMSIVVYFQCKIMYLSMSLFSMYVNNKGPSQKLLSTEAKICSTPYTVKLSSCVLYCRLMAMLKVHAGEKLSHTIVAYRRRHYSMQSLKAIVSFFQLGSPACSRFELYLALQSLSMSKNTLFQFPFVIFLFIFLNAPYP